MKLTKRDIQKIKTAHKRAEKAENEMSIATQNLAMVITDITKVDGNVDCMAGDGFGFTPLSNDDTHIPIDKLISLAEGGVDITEDEILSNLSL